jgi:2-dehydro-3-deoxygluconokinase
MAAQPDIVIIGPLNVDIIAVGDAPREPDELIRWMGLSKISINAAGSAGYVLMDLQKLGGNCGIMSVLSSDPMSAFLLRTLQDAGIDTSRVRTKAGAPGIAIYMLLFGDKKRPLTGQLATHAPWPDSFSDDDLTYIAGARLLHVAGYLHYPRMWGDYMAGALKHTKNSGALTSLDPQFPLSPVETPWMTALEDMIGYVDIFLSDEDEARSITALDDLDDAAQNLLDAGPDVVVIKRGAQGSLIFAADGTRIEQLPYVIEAGEVSDSIGAGDAYDAGFLFGVLENWPLERAAQFASTVAALSVYGSGGTETAPDYEMAERARIVYYE